MGTLCDFYGPELRAINDAPEVMSPTEWSEKHLIMNERSSPWPGPFRMKRSEYLRDIVDGIGSRVVEEVTAATAPQVGKTTAIQCQLGFVIDQDPGPSLLVMPNERLAQSYSESRLQPLFQDTAKIASHIKTLDSEKIDKKNYKKLEMHFDRMTLALVGANSPANLSSRPIRYLWLDELDKFPAASKREAAAADLAVERTKRFWNKKIVRTSTPTLTTGEIWKNFKRGDQRYFWVPCPHCGVHQKLVFEQIKWAPELKDSDGRWNLDKVKETAYYECEACKMKIRDHHKVRMLERGEWRPTGESKTHRSYQLSALYPLGLRFGDVAAEFLKSKPYPDSLRNFVNSWLGEPWEERGESADEGAILQHKEGYEEGVCPVEPIATIITADVQQDCCYYAVRAWLRDETSYLVRFGVVPDLNALNDITAAVYRCPNGPFSVTHGFIDSGYNTDEVYRFCDRNGWMATKGHDASQQAQPTRAVMIDGLQLLHIQSDYFKDLLQLKLKIRKGDTGAWYLPHNANSEYAYQLAAESKIETADKLGRIKHSWKRLRKDNHWLDCEVMQLAAVNYLGIRFLPEPKKDVASTRATSPQGFRRPDGREWMDLAR